MIAVMLVMMMSTRQADISSQAILPAGMRSKIFTAYECVPRRPLLKPAATLPHVEDL